ncbi:MAG: hypothetical protein SGI96_21265 [Bacteroidota bacterium]|nr:hypothetical protein [Bacteroidota bacterium]
MITIPEKKPELLKNLEVDFGTTIAQSIWQRVAWQLNFMSASVPIGLIMYFYQSQTLAGGGSIPAPVGTWQFCDGVSITDADSPLFGQNTPDFRLLIKKQDTPILTTGGVATHDLAHDHEGFTGFTTDLEAGNFRTDFGFDKAQGNSHRHAILSALGDISTLPPYVELQPYMRIK